jgi:hypothetical protein
LGGPTNCVRAAEIAGRALHTATTNKTELILKQFANIGRTSSCFMRPIFPNRREAVDLNADS